MTKNKHLIQEYYDHLLEHKKAVAQQQVTGAKVQHWLQETGGQNAVIDQGQYWLVHLVR